MLPQVHQNTPLHPYIPTPLHTYTPTPLHPYTPTGAKEAPQIAPGHKNEKAKTLFALARLTGASGAVTPGACKHCGQTGHLSSQCRNKIKLHTKDVNMDILEPTDDDDDDDDDSDSDSSSKSRRGHTKRSRHSIDKKVRKERKEKKKKKKRKKDKSH
eukprot:GHVR01045822.1.p1 GENE.GHVR01045822.1~~GHVR01045822.1.p1  ORF type:complete len:157 (-),score=44.96 GHVR01045822.1:68-538(-)